MKPWHMISSSEIFEVLKTTKNGLREGDAQKRLKTHGLNRLPEKPAPKWWQIFLRQFHSPLIYILAIAALVSLFIGEHSDAGFIAVVLFINAVIGSYQEWKAEQSSRALQKILQIRASVQRDGEIKEINAEQLVPGDIVWLESGNRVPADIRLVSAHGLEIDESLLSGESLPVLKDCEWRGDEKTSVADRKNMTHAGSTVVRGRAHGVVVATGVQTAVGQLALDVLETTGGKPPLILRMERFSHVIAMVVLLAASLVGVIGVFLRGFEVSEMFLFGVALAVSAIPEGLPVALTVALAIGTTRMARRGVIVRRLPAVEGLGSCTVIASDKTGTLTCNEITAREIYLAEDRVFEVSGEGFSPNGEICHEGKKFKRGSIPSLDTLVKSSVLCNEGDLHHLNGNWVWRGDPTDIAILSMGHKLGFDRESLLTEYEQVNEIPFEPEHQFSATFHKANNETFAFVKGAPERILGMCSGYDSATLQKWSEIAERMAHKGYRVLAVAEAKGVSGLDSAHAPEEPADLSFLGYIGMIDPLRAEVKQAVQSCFEAGIAVSMVTGDHPATALAIGKELGFAQHKDEVITGLELEGKTESELQSIIKERKIFARVAPHQKLQLVKAARELGHFVAVTGDGVNDAPALREANIGVSMGKSGTDVAREASELVISDDNFATIVAGVEEGRVAYDNVRKVIYLLISTGFAEVILVGLALATGMPLPLLPVQLLWLNLVTNGIQDVALACEPSEGDVLKKKPRPPREPIFNRLMIERTVVASTVIGIAGFAVFVWLLKLGFSEHSARNALLLLMVLFENVHIGNCRSETKSALSLSPFKSPILLIGTLCAMGIHIVALYTPIGQSVLETEPVSLKLWGLLLPVALTLFVAMEIHKWTWWVRNRNEVKT